MECGSISRALPLVLTLAALAIVLSSQTTVREGFNPYYTPPLRPCPPARDASAPQDDEWSLRETRDVTGVGQPYTTEELSEAVMLVIRGACEAKPETSWQPGPVSFVQRLGDIFHLFLLLFGDGGLVVEVEARANVSRGDLEGLIFESDRPVARYSGPVEPYMKIRNEQGYITSLERLSE
jgi:hypothetical protein